MKELKNKSNRGILIESIVRNLIDTDPFINIIKFKEYLQKELNSKLTFEASVSDFEVKSGFTVGYIYFKNEYGSDSIIDITVD